VGGHQDGGWGAHRLHASGLERLKALISTALPPRRRALGTGTQIGVSARRARPSRHRAPRRRHPARRRPVRRRRAVDRRQTNVAFLVVVYSSRAYYNGWETRSSPGHGGRARPYRPDFRGQRRFAKLRNPAAGMRADRAAGRRGRAAAPGPGRAGQPALVYTMLQPRWVSPE
jgi:hypothetical protein